MLSGCAVTGRQKQAETCYATEKINIMSDAVVTPMMAFNAALMLHSLIIKL